MQKARCKRGLEYEEGPERMSEAQHDLHGRREVQGPYEKAAELADEAAEQSNSLRFPTLHCAETCGLTMLSQA